MARWPKVSIGIPVFNGARYLSLAFDSLLAQTHDDFEIIVSDNASTDATPKIIRRYVEQDSRIRSYRNAKNLGAAANFNQVFKLSRGEYFKWAAHDDICAPGMIEQSVIGLDENPEAVLAYTKAVEIDSEGNMLGTFDFELHGDCSWPSERFRHQIHINHSCLHVFGLIRADTLRRTRLIGRFVASDRVLLAHLALLGQFFEVPDRLFCHREHAERSTRISALHNRAGWFDSKKVGAIVFPNWRLLFEYLLTIWRCRLTPKERMLCHWHLMRWMMWYRKRMMEDLRISARLLRMRIAAGSLL